MRDHKGGLTIKEASSELGFGSDHRGALHSVTGLLAIHDAADAERGQHSAELWQEAGIAAFIPAEEGDIQGCGGSGRGQDEVAGDHRVSAGAAEIPEAGRADSQRGAADGGAGHGKDADGARLRGRRTSPFFLECLFYCEQVLLISIIRSRRLFIIYLITLSSLSLYPIVIYS